MASEVSGAGPAHTPKLPRDGNRPSTSKSHGSKSTLEFLCGLAKAPLYCGLMSSSEMVDYNMLRLGPVIGKGAYAVVALCEKPDFINQLYTRHAVKQLKPAVANDKVELKFFLLEAHIISQLHHKNVIKFDGFGLRKPKEIRTAFYVMEHLPGGSLKGQFHREHGAARARALFSSSDAIRWSVELCSAMAYMHGLDSPIVHRDIKLENILLTSTQNHQASIKLADFGLAVQMAHRETYTQEEALERLAALRTDQSGPIGENSNETWYHLTGQSGSLLYMAPEVFLNLPYNEKADIFSLGVVLYELFTATMIADVVLEERTWAEAKEFAKKVAHGHRIRLNTVPRDIAVIIKACWQQDPTQRPPAFLVLQRLMELEKEYSEAQAARARGAPHPRPDLNDTRNNRSWVQRSISKISRALQRRLSI